MLYPTLCSPSSLYAIPITKDPSKEHRLQLDVLMQPGREGLGFCRLCSITTRLTTLVPAHELTTAYLMTAETGH